MTQNPYEMILFYEVLIFGICYFFIRLNITRTHKQTTEMLRTLHKQTMESFATRPRIDFDSVMDEIKEDGRQTRLSIDKRTQSALEAIRAPLVNRGGRA